MKYERRSRHVPVNQIAVTFTFYLLTSKFTHFIFVSSGVFSISTYERGVNFRRFSDYLL